LGDVIIQKGGKPALRDLRKHVRIMQKVDSNKHFGMKKTSMKKSEVGERETKKVEGQKKKKGGNRSPERSANGVWEFVFILYPRGEMETASDREVHNLPQRIRTQKGNRELRPLPLKLSCISVRGGRIGVEKLWEPEFGKGMTAVGRCPRKMKLRLRFGPDLAKKVPRKGETEKKACRGLPS